MDFEEQLDQFFVRKEDALISLPVSTNEPKKNSKQLHCSKDVFNCIPLMLKHIRNLNKNWKENTNVIQIFSDKVQFKNCLVYGKIMSKGKESKSIFSYVLDDGTASLDICLFRKTSDMETVWKLENELQAIRREMLAQNKNEIVESLRNLLFKTKQQIDHSNIKIGSNVLLYGKPTCYRGQISLSVYCLMKDENLNRDIEISFKDCLIDWYTNNCMFLTNCS